MHQPSNGSTLQPLVDKLVYRVHLDAGDRAAILALPFTVKIVERAQYIVRERELAKHSCMMLSGYSIRSKVTATGTRQIVAIHNNRLTQAWEEGHPALGLHFNSHSNLLTI